MDELHKLHDAITSLWQFIKKYDPNLHTEEDWQQFMDEADEIIAKYDKDMRDMLLKWIMFYAEYVDKREKRIIQ